MIGNSLLAAVLTVVSAASLSLLSVLCLRCKKKSKVIHEEHQVYDPQTFQRGGSKFAVTRSKTVTRANQITSTTVETQEEFEEYSASTNEPSNYQNVLVESLEHTYVDPLPITVYENEPIQDRMTDTNQTPGVYANITTSLPIKSNTTQIKDDEDDYENSDFLDQVAHQQEDNEPDYVNEHC